ncbi:VCBS repeat-containing protein [candidate division KSB1 bacterium]|nr:VCBS repeat-containing protein [candidate division KSB1 bacterium]
MKNRQLLTTLVLLLLSPGLFAQNKMVVMERSQQYSTASSDSQNYVWTAKLSEPVVPDPPFLTFPVDGDDGEGTSVCLNWQKVNDATYYQIQIDSDPNFSSPKFIQANTHLTYFIFSGLEEQTTYYWRVQARDAYSQSKWSSVRRFTTMTKPPLSLQSHGKFSFSLLYAGDRYYVDRDFTVISIPQPLQGAVWIKTPNEDKADNSSAYLSFQLEAPANVHVAYDFRGSFVPQWLSRTFDKTEYQIFVSDKAEKLTVWSRYCSPGFYTLGGNMAPGAAGAKSNYVVLVDFVDFVLTSETTCIVPVYNSSQAFGDYDNDGDLDLAISGFISNTEISRIYSNNGSGQYIDPPIELAGARAGAVSWFDYDGDGALDVTSAIRKQSSRALAVFKNQGNNSFTPIELDLIYSSGTFAWGDYDNDGDGDLLFSGIDTTGTKFVRLFQNRDTELVPVSTCLEGHAYGTVAWADYDEDSDLDVLMCGSTNELFAATTIYQNTAPGQFEKMELEVPGVTFGSAQWGDYNNDGRLDILQIGWNQDKVEVLDVYRNLGNGHFDLAARLEGAVFGTARWGDYDNDGDVDILMMGRSTDKKVVSKIYRNDNGDFKNMSAEITGLNVGAADWADVDNDGDLDIFLSGLDSVQVERTLLYRNDFIMRNSAPTVPKNLNIYFSEFEKRVYLSWEKSEDNETPSNALSYNLCVGTEPGLCNIVSPLSDKQNGFRKVVQFGNVSGATGWQFINLAPGTYYWRVQAIDAGYCGSAFSESMMFHVDETPIVPFIYDFDKSGWYLISVPGNTPDGDMTVSNLFPDAFSDVFTFENNQYQKVDNLQVGKGYLLYFENPCIQRLYLIPVTEFSIIFPKEGWYLLGSVSEEIEFTHPSVIPDNSVQLPVYSHDNNTFNPSSVLVPQKGYWIGVLRACTLFSSTDPGIAGLEPEGDFFTDRHGKYPPNLPPVPDVLVDHVSTPNNFNVFQNYPNPFNASTNVEYELPADGYIDVVVYNLHGERILHMGPVFKTAGRHRFVWNGENDQARLVSSGIYLIQVSSETNRQTIKTMFVK